MIDWRALRAEVESETETVQAKEVWRNDAAESICELYFETYKANGGRGSTARIDHRRGSDFRRYMDSHLTPLHKHGVWEALFPNKLSATSAGAIDEALHLLADSKLVDRVYSDDIVTVNKIVGNIKKKRAKYLEL